MLYLWCAIDRKCYLTDTICHTLHWPSALFIVEKLLQASVALLSITCGYGVSFYEHIRIGTETGKRKAHLVLHLKFMTSSVCLSRIFFCTGIVLMIGLCMLPCWASPTFPAADSRTHVLSPRQDIYLYPCCFLLSFSWYCPSSAVLAGIESVNWTISVTINGFYFQLRQNKNPKPKFMCPSPRCTIVFTTASMLCALCVLLSGSFCFRWDFVSFAFPFLSGVSTTLSFGWASPCQKSETLMQFVAVSGNWCLEPQLVLFA